MTTNLHSILHKKYIDRNLASLYIAYYDSAILDPELWVNQFLGLFTKLEDHPDILKIFKEAKENEYKVESKSIQNFLKFINYKPLQLEKKFIFIFDAQDMNVSVSNKLLKVFEELGTNFCVFLMLPDNALMLPTVLSRAIKLRISDSNTQEGSALDFSKIQAPQDLLAFIKQNKENDYQIEKKFMEQSIQGQLSKSKASAESYLELDELLKKLKDNEVYNNFNNSKQSRIARFFP